MAKPCPKCAGSGAIERVTQTKGRLPWISREKRISEQCSECGGSGQMSIQQEVDSTVEQLAARLERSDRGYVTIHAVHEAQEVEHLIQMGLDGTNSLAAIASEPPPHRARQFVAALALGRMGDVRAVPLLIEAMKFAPRSAAILLKKFGRAVDTDLLASLLPDALVARLLNELGWQPATGEQKVLLAIARDDWAKIVQIGGPVAERAIQSATERHSALAPAPAALAIALARLHDSRGLPMMRDILKRDHPFENDRTAVVRALGTLKGSAESAKVLIDFVSRRLHASGYDRAPSEGDIWTVKLRELAVQQCGQRVLTEAVPALVNLLDTNVPEMFLDISYCESTVHALEAILGRGGKNVATEHLNVLAGIRDIELDGWKPAIQGRFHGCRREKLKASCLRLRVLAAAELASRA